MNQAPELFPLFRLQEPPVRHVGNATLERAVFAAMELLLLLLLLAMTS